MQLFLGTKLILNIPITKFTKVAKQGEKIIRILGMNFADNITECNTLKTYLLKLKSSEVSSLTYPDLIKQSVF
jgi:hypothetical protein